MDLQRDLEFINYVGVICQVFPSEDKFVIIIDLATDFCKNDDTFETKFTNMFRSFNNHLQLKVELI